MALPKNSVICGTLPAPLGMVSPSAAMLNPNRLWVVVLGSTRIARLNLRAKQQSHYLAAPVGVVIG